MMDNILITNDGGSTVEAATFGEIKAMF